MPTVYLRKDLHEAIVLRHQDVNSFVNKVVEDALKQSSVQETKAEEVKPKTKK